MISNFYSEKTTANAIKNPKKRLHFLNMRLDFLTVSEKRQEQRLAIALKAVRFCTRYIYYIALQTRRLYTSTSKKRIEFTARN